MGSGTKNCRIWWFGADLAVQTIKSCCLEPEPDFNYSTITTVDLHFLASISFNGIIWEYFFDTKTGQRLCHDLNADENKKRWRLCSFRPFFTQRALSVKSIPRHWIRNKTKPLTDWMIKYKIIRHDTWELYNAKIFELFHLPTIVVFNF